jgi:hypothetical protein
MDAQTGYVVGESGTILKTTNGGVTWTIQNSGTTYHLKSVHFPSNGQTGYVLGGYYVMTGIILKTTNGGANWINQTPNSTYDLHSVYFPVDAQTGYVAGYYGSILKTTDGGGVWVEEKTEERNRKYEFRLKVTPNPFTSFASVPGHEAEGFTLYDISGRRVGTYRGDRVGTDLAPGVYFLRPVAGGSMPVRIVKVR